MNKEQQSPFKICDDYLAYADTVYTINKQWQEKIKETLKLMDQIILKIDNDESVEDFEFKTIEEIINLLTNLTFDVIVDKRLNNFIHSYIFLAHNINENTFKYPGVFRKIKYLQRFTENCLTYPDLQGLLKKVLSRIPSDNFIPPSFRLSKHYYDLIKEG